MDKKKDRILQIRDYFCNGNNREFAKKLNMSEQYASNMTHGTKNISATFLNKILDAFPDVDRTWLYFGEGSMLKNNNTGDISNNHAGGDILGNGAVKTTPENDTTIAELVAIIKRLTETNKQQSEQITKLIDLLSTTK